MRFNDDFYVMSVEDAALMKNDSEERFTNNGHENDKMVIKKEKKCYLCDRKSTANTSETEINIRRIHHAKHAYINNQETS